MRRHFPLKLYATLLFLYPTRFRVRFGPEMTQVFQDTWLETASRSGVIEIAMFWWRTLRDVASSVLEQWREDTSRFDSELDVSGLADAFMITIVVGTNLMVWGWTGAVVTLGELHAGYGFWSIEAMTLTAIVAVSLAVLLGVLSTSLVARNPRIERHRIKA
ncbi:MAG: hypothetical protein HY646_22190 [Acidobacteria bacterium]|nr:hypothetical protein [Acidobacteriota bacterium]